MDKEDVVCVCVCVCVYNQLLLSHKKEMLPFATTWMNLEGITLGEISQRKKNTVCYHLQVESKK